MTNEVRSPAFYRDRHHAAIAASCLALAGEVMSFLGRDHRLSSFILPRGLMLVKTYGSEQAEVRYSPATFAGSKKIAVTGSPDMKHVSTSYVERQNLTMRMGMRRFTRLTNGFSKKIENLQAAISLHFLHYNFARIHQTLRVTPAMAAGIADHAWELEEIVGLLG